MSTVIKAGQAGTLLTRPRTFDLNDHVREASGTLEAARRKAEEIIARAEREAVDVRGRAEKVGFAEGHRSGRAEGERTGRETAHAEAVAQYANEQASLMAAMQSAVSHLDATKEDLAIEAERNLLDFAVEVASRLTFAIGRLHRDAVRTNLRKAIDRVGSTTSLTIRVHPEDLKTLRDFAESTLQQLNASRSVELVEDESIAPGGCIVETTRTRIDARLETQVDEMLLLLLGENRTNDG